MRHFLSGPEETGSVTKLGIPATMLKAPGKGELTKVVTRMEEGRVHQINKSGVLHPGIFESKTGAVRDLRRGRNHQGDVVRRETLSGEQVAIGKSRVPVGVDEATV